MHVLRCRRAPLYAAPGPRRISLLAAFRADATAARRTGAPLRVTEVVRVRLETTRGAIVLRCGAHGTARRRSIPRLVRAGYYDDGRRSFASAPACSHSSAFTAIRPPPQRWRHATIPDDPRVVSNTGGAVAYASGSGRPDDAGVHQSCAITARPSMSSRCGRSRAVVEMEFRRAVCRVRRSGRRGNSRRQSRTRCPGWKYLSPREFPKARLHSASCDRALIHRSGISVVLDVPEFARFDSYCAEKASRRARLIAS